MAELSAKQARFVEEYLLDLNATAAARRAGYAESTATKRAPLWVGKSRDRCPDSYLAVWDTVQAAKEERAKRNKLTQERILEELAALGFIDLSNIVEVVDGKLKVKDAATLMTSKTKSLELLGRHFGMFTDRIEIPNSGGVLRVPATADAKDWDEKAKAQQAALARRQDG